MILAQPSRIPGDRVRAVVVVSKKRIIPD